MKLDRPAPAKQFYNSPLFRAALGYAERTCDALFIVSALYGAVEPTAVLEPYDRSLRKFKKREREEWGVRTIGDVLSMIELPARLVVLAGEVYADALAQGAKWRDLPKPAEPLRGIAGGGRRIGWLTQPASARAGGFEHRPARLA